MCIRDSHPLIASKSLSLKELIKRPKVGIIQIITKNNNNNCDKIDDNEIFFIIFFVPVDVYISSRQE